MARPQNKSELITQAEHSYTKLLTLIESMTPDEQNAEFDFSGQAGREAHWQRDKSLRDVLIHLYEWHRLLLDFIRENSLGPTPPVPLLPEPYTWKNYGQMNEGFIVKHRQTSLEEAIALLAQSHGEVMDVVASYSNEELFEKKHFPWTGTTSLGAYCVSSTCSHYEWAMKKIRRHIRLTRAAHPRNG